jgi:hypothetical protein
MTPSLRRKSAEHLNPRSDALDNRGSDEDTIESPDPEAWGQDRALEGVDLAPVAVAPDDEIDPAEGPLVRPAVDDLGGEQDHPRAGAEDWQVVRDQPSQRLPQPGGLDEERHRGRLPARQYEGVDAVEISRPSDLDRLGAEPVEYSPVLPDVALEGEDPDPLHLEARSYQPRTASRSRTSSRPIPTIASPRPRDTFATRTGSS